MSDPLEDSGEAGDRPEDPREDPNVLTPDDLTIEDEDVIEKIGENRYVVSSGARKRGEERRTDPGGERRRSPTPLDDSGDDADGADAAAPGPSPDARAVALERAAGRHGIDVVLKTGDGISERRIAADDQVAAFEEFLAWYARQIDESRPPSATIAALLAEADLDD